VANDVFVRVRQVGKQFNGVTVLRDVDLDLKGGEVHGLLGENGAGKSTLIKILSGVYQPDMGTLEVNGQQVTINGPSTAHKLGIFTVHQEPATFPYLTVAENIFMGFHPSRRFLFDWIDRKTMYKKAEEVFKRLGISMNVRKKAEELSIAQQQMVEIAKALIHDVKVLILDEPTATLTMHETEILFRIIRQLQKEGKALLFVSHRLDEVFELTSRITVLRDGQKVGTEPTAQMDEKRLVSMMVGREVELHRFRNEEVKRTSPVLEVKQLTNAAGRFRDISFELYPGEIVGFAGLVGSGRTDVAETLFGIQKASSGEIHLEGKPVRIPNVNKALELGIAYIPEDRHRHGVALEMDIASNTSLPSLKALSKGGFIRFSEERALAGKMIDRLKIRTSSYAQRVGELSGGNQQKVVFSKWIPRNPKIMILDEPTRGVDVGSKQEIHKMIHELAQEGMAVMLISSDLPEILNLADRVVVMREGRIMAEVTGRDINEVTIGSYAAGVQS
jgi:ABC-type sugar transport system ATPase subunit